MRGARGPPQKPALTLLSLTSFQVPWFGTIPIAVSNDISEQSLEEFSREVRDLLLAFAGATKIWGAWGGCESHLGLCPWVRTG